MELHGITSKCPEVISHIQNAMKTTFLKGITWNLLHTFFRDYTVTAWGGGAFSAPPPRLFRNNSWTQAEIDMKLGMTLRTSILRRLVKKNPIRENNFEI